MTYEVTGCSDRRMRKGSPVVPLHNGPAAKRARGNSGGQVLHFGKLSALPTPPGGNALNVSCESGSNRTAYPTRRQRQQITATQ